MSEIIEEAINSEDKKIDFSDDEILMDHRIEDLFYGHHPGLSLGRATSIFRSRGQLAYFLYINRVTKYLFVAIYMDWTILFRHPVNFFLLVIFFATSISLLFVAGIFIPIYTFYRYCTKSEREPVINVWGKIAKIPPPNRNLINDLMEGMKLLGNNTKRTIIKDEKKIGALGERENLKRVSKLKSLLFFSTLVYKRESKITYKIQGCVRKLKSKLKYDDIGDQKVYKRVYKKLCDCEKKENERENNNDNNNNNNDNYNDDNIYTFEDIEHKIRDMIGKDEKKIKEQIKEFDLNFTSISELNTDDGGSFCGMFWSDKENFIIIAFKGTTPTNFAEWLGNLTFQCVDARNYLFGQVHRGFYNYLFPLDEESAGKNYPCQKIIESINCKATTLKKMNGRKVNLWITGHSLGGALATLFYARLLNINYTHESWELQGAITFASPAVGDINFSTQLAALINDPRNLAKPLWRIVLNDDIVPKMPYRACNKRMRKYGYHYNVLMNYAQVGDKVTFYGNDHDPTSIKEFFSNESDKDDNIGEHVNRLKSYCKNYCKKKKSKPLGIFRHRHGSNSYFKALIDYEKKIGKK
ncbi:unnamed protein product [Rhizophagus irregularis]|nr:unnamed protein product [Rhizophagus irregularis]CAB5384697.1 unnamed protein product [Rhizophagus irregularis]